MGSPWIRGAVYVSMGFKLLLQATVICMFHSLHTLAESTWVYKALFVHNHSIPFEKNGLDLWGRGWNTTPEISFLWSCSFGCSIRYQLARATGMTGSRIHAMQRSTPVNTVFQICKLPCWYPVSPIIVLDVLVPAVQLPQSAESGPLMLSTFHVIFKTCITQQSNLCRPLIIFPNTSLELDDDDTGFVHAWDFLLCSAGRTREVPGLKLVERKRSQGLYNRAVFPKVGYGKDEQKGTRGRGNCENMDDVILRMSISENIWQRFLFLMSAMPQKLEQMHSHLSVSLLNWTVSNNWFGNVDNLVTNGHVLGLFLEPMPRWPILHISTKNKVTSFWKVLSTSCSYCVHKLHYKFLFSNSWPQKNFEAAGWLYVLPLTICLFILVQT